MRRWLCVDTLSISPLLAIAAEPGWFGAAAVGRTTYNSDCSFDFRCRSGARTAAKLGTGYQFGVFGLESWLVNYGSSSLDTGDRVRLDSIGLNTVWRWPWSPAVQGVLRAGVASVHQSRKGENFRLAEGTFGLGLALDVVPSVAIDLAWDFVTSTGGSDRIGTVIAQPVTLGLRLRF